MATLWLQGSLPEIMTYNECDALTTYLIWLRTAHLGGFFTESEYEEEQPRVRQIFEKEGALLGKEHLLEFLQEWECL